VAERTREIGIKRAIGGSRGRIIRELVAEAGGIGLIGGLIGLALGGVVVVLANEAGRAGGTVLFDHSTRCGGSSTSARSSSLMGVGPADGRSPDRPGHDARIVEGQTAALRGSSASRPAGTDVGMFVVWGHR